MVKGSKRKSSSNFLSNNNHSLLSHESIDGEIPYSSSRRDSTTSAFSSIRTSNVDKLLLATTMKDMFQEKNNRKMSMKRLITIYKNTSFIRQILLLSGILILLISKPVWCKKIIYSQDCTMNIENQDKFSNFSSFYISRRFVMYYQCAVLVLVMVCYCFKCTLYNDFKKRRLRLLIKSALLTIFIVSMIFEILGLQTHFGACTYIIFLISHLKIVRRAWLRVWFIVLEIYQIIIL